jgi:hypothetical protein
MAIAAADVGVSAIVGRDGRRRLGREARCRTPDDDQVNGYVNAG